MNWRVAKSLLQLRSQVNEACPARQKSFDGTIGDEAHASRASDHNPWVHDAGGMGVVTALDLTHDPANGFDSYAFAEYLRGERDSRIKYVISNGRIFNSKQSPWQWRRYSGANRHDHHVHVSVLDVESIFDDDIPWDLTGFGFKPDKKAPTVPQITVLAKGNRGAEVEELQKLLGVEVDGQFGPKTEDAVRLFQKTNGLVPDGVVGIATWSKLRKGK